MEMKINFNKLFEISDSDSHTPSTTSLQNSYHFDEPSVMSYTSNHINLHYKFNEALFFDSQATMQNEQQMNILGDLSSIGRSFEDSFEKQTPLKQAQKSHKASKQTPKVDKEKKEEQFFTKQTFGIGQKIAKTPGQRLYYEHKINEERRLREVERLRMQKQEQQKKQITFKPAINQKSKKILQLADSPLRKLQNFKKSQKQKQHPEQVKSTAQKKYQQDLKNCTFHPALTKTPKNKFTMNSLNERRNKDQVFQELYNDHKIKEMKRKKAELELSKRQKKMTQEQLEEFLNRHDEYLQQKLHKEELMRAVSSQYDLSSGRKLFQPKINETSEALLSSASVKKFISSPSSKKFIFHEESHQAHGFDSKVFLNSEKSRSGKSRGGKSKSGKSGKSRSSSKNNKTIGSKKSLFQKVAKNEQIPKKVQKEGQVKKETHKTINNKNQFQPLPYQVTKVKSDEKVSQKNKIFSKDEDVTDKGYQRPSSTIFTKIKATESVFEEKNEEESNKSQRSDRKSQRKHSVSNEGDQQRRQVDLDQQSGKESRNEQKKMSEYGNQQGHKIQVAETADRQEINVQSHQFYGDKQQQKEAVCNQTNYVGFSNDESTPQHFTRQYEDLYAQKYQSKPQQETQPHRWGATLFDEHQQHPNYRMETQEEQQVREDNEFHTQNHYQRQDDSPYKQYEENQLSQEEHHQHKNDAGSDEDHDIIYEPYNHQQAEQNDQEEKNLQLHNKSHSYHSQTYPQQEQQAMKSSFLKSISSNPQNNQKYQNLFQMGQQFNRSHQSSPQTQRESCSSDEPQHQVAFKLENVPNFTNMINEPSDSHLSEKEEVEHEVVQQKVQQLPDVPCNSEFQTHQHVNEQTPTQTVQKQSQNPKKNWQQIFNSSAYASQSPNPYQSQHSSRQKRTNQEPKESQVTLKLEESPKKKPINIASLLKGKKKLPPKTQLN